MWGIIFWPGFKLSQDFSCSAEMWTSSDTFRWRFQTFYTSIDHRYSRVTRKHFTVGRKLLTNTIRVPYHFQLAFLPFLGQLYASQSLRLRESKKHSIKGSDTKRHVSFHFNKRDLLTQLPVPHRLIAQSKETCHEAEPEQSKHFFSFTIFRLVRATIDIAQSTFTVKRPLSVGLNFVTYEMNISVPLAFCYSSRWTFFAEHIQQPMYIKSVKLFEISTLRIRNRIALEKNVADTSLSGKLPSYQVT